MELKEIIIGVQNLDLIELQKVKSIVETLITLKKDIESVTDGTFKFPNVKLQQGKRQPIAMIDEEGNTFKKFNGFTSCANYLKEEFELKNHQNRLRKAIEEDEDIEGYRFILLPVEDRKPPTNKRKSVLMIDENGEVVEEFKNLHACEVYLKEEMNVKNQRVKLRKAMEDNTDIEGYRFIFGD